MTGFFFRSIYCLLFALAAITSRADCTLLHNATIIDPASARVQAGADVVIEGNHIASIGKAAEAAASTQKQPHCGKTVDIDGRFLLPGFSDLHAHLFLHPWDEKGNIRPRWDRASIEQMLRTLLAYGVTTIRDPGSETEAAITLRGMLAKGDIAGPQLFTCGRILNDSDFDPEPFQPVHDATAVRREIRWQKAAGVDCIKVYSSMKPELLKVAIDEAHALGLPVIGHLQRTTWAQAAELGIDGVEHPAWWSPSGGSLFDRVTWLESLSSDEITSTAKALAAHHVVMDATLIAMETKFFGDEHLHDPLALVPPLHARGWAAGAFTRDWTPAQFAAAKKAWPKLLSITKAMHDAGVVITVGTDTPTPWIVPGESVHREMQFLHDAGLSNMEVLRAATSNAAAALHLTDRGAIRPGMRADLVVLEANPLPAIENTKRIVYVMKAGTLYEPHTLLTAVAGTADVAGAKPGN
jgi:imidazolonepropionase-like amidohydrolase